MEAKAAAYLGMGLCLAGLFGAALGIAYIFAKTIETVGRQPNAEARVAKYCWIGFALVESLALFALIIALIIMP
jgi:F-type H+-transporting ATPase subunit c